VVLQWEQKTGKAFASLSVAEREGANKEIECMKAERAAAATATRE